MTLTYWYAACLDDSNVYSVRERTKKEALRVIAGRTGDYGPVIKLSVRYKDGFDLMEKCSQEDRSWWEYTPKGQP